MKKRYAAAVAAALLAVLALSLFSCGRQKIVGTWENTEDKDYKITFCSDGKCEIVQGEYVMEAKYRIAGNNIEISYNNNSYPLLKTGTFSVENDVLSTEIDGISETYVKVK